MKKIVTVILSTLLCVLTALGTFAADVTETARGIVSQREQSLAQSVLTAANPREADWFAIAMSRLGFDGDYAAYAEKTKADITARYAESGGLDRSRSTEWARAILVLLACGENPENIDGVNLLNDGIYYRESLGRQGINAYCYALIALTAANSEAPKNAVNTPDSIIDALLAKELESGGFCLVGTSADADITALALTSLSPYADKRADVKAVTDRAAGVLSALQNNDGGYSSMGTPNCESTAQVLVGLCSTGIDVRTDERYIKNGSTVLDGLMRYRLENGAFCHITDKPTANPVASEQALYALAAMHRFERGETALYDFGGVIKHSENTQSDAQSAPNGENDTQSDVQTAPTTPSSEQTTTADENAVQSNEQTATVDETTPVPQTQNAVAESSSLGVQQIISIVFFATAAVFAALWLWKRRKDFLVLGAICAAIGVVLCFVKFTGTEEFYGNVENPTDKTVTFSITCVKAVENGLPENLKGAVSADGIIFPETEIGINDDDSVFDVLLRAVKSEKIQLEYSGASGSEYIMGISNLYEYDMGELSGWMYRVNNEYPSSSCGAYKLHGGEAVELIYSLDLGRDVGDNY